VFTGIVRALGTIVTMVKKGDLLHYALSFPHENLKLGASVSVDGVCQTVVKIEDETVWFDAIGETLKRTTLNTMEVGQKVNIERSAKIGDEIGGHLLSGHIYGTATISQVKENIYTFQCPIEWMKYLFSKGFIAIDGMSLTVVDVHEDCFTIHLIPETLQRTTLGQKKVGDRVNLEFDSQTQVTVETIERRLF